MRFGWLNAFRLVFFFFSFFSLHIHNKKITIPSTDRLMVAFVLSTTLWHLCNLWFKSHATFHQNLIIIEIWPKTTQKGAFFEIFKNIIWAQQCSYGNCPCIKSLLNFFWIHSSSGFPGISRKSWPKIAQKGAFFKIFKPII